MSQKDIEEEYERVNRIRQALKDVEETTKIMRAREIQELIERNAHLSKREQKARALINYDEGIITEDEYAAIVKVIMEGEE